MRIRSGILPVHFHHQGFRGSVELRLQLRGRPGPRLEAVAPDQPGAGRPAHQSPEHDPHRRGGEREDARAPEAGLLEDRGKGEPGGGPADQGHRAGHHAEQRVLLEAGGDRHAGEVLHQAEGGREDEEHQHLEPAGPEQGQAGAHSYRSEEGDAEGGLKRGVQLKVEDPVVQQQDQEGKEKAAEDGGRDVEGIEPANPLPQLDAGEVDQRGQGEGLQQIELELDHPQSKDNPGPATR